MKSLLNNMIENKISLGQTDFKWNFAKDHFKSIGEYSFLCIVKGFFASSFIYKLIGFQENKFSP